MNKESIRDNNLTQRPDEALETSSPTAVGGAASSSKQTISPSTTPSLLPTAKEIIEESGSQVSSEQESSTKNVASFTPTVCQPTSRPSSPDYTSSFVNPFASGKSSSEGRVQAYLTRKIESLERDSLEQEALVGASKDVKASESEPILMIPSTSFQLSPSGQDPTGPKVSFLGPVLDASSQKEPERPQGANKRPRIGSTSYHESHPPAKQRAPPSFRTTNTKRRTQKLMSQKVKKTFGLLQLAVVNLQLKLVQQSLRL